MAVKQYNPEWFEIIMDPDREFTAAQYAEYRAFILAEQRGEYGPTVQGVHL